ncbi:MAG: AbrB/MazE/SpoVT family DNA-binding domain-containing protein [Clostridiales bacterium]|nr:AbrB/MazE/SpoVT family DNA-binding domain-containing protein [Clostridiales bacterium]
MLFSCLERSGLFLTIPIEIRKKLGIKNGDKVLFMEDSGRIYMMN